MQLNTYCSQFKSMSQKKCNNPA